MGAQGAGAKYRVVLTGASGGIGSAIARELAPHAALLILVGRNLPALQALRDALPGATVEIVCGDLGDPATLAAIEAVAHRHGGINLLVNNAGISDFHAYLSQPGDVIRNMIDTNLLAPMLLTRQLLPLLLAAPSAQVVNVGSVFGLIGFPGFAAYCAGKSGLRGFSQALRRELADTRVAVRHFAPRATRTGINSAAVEAMNAELNTAEDSPQQVAADFFVFLQGRAWERTLGAKERFFIFLNKLVPALPERAMRSQLPVIRRHLPK